MGDVFVFQEGALGLEDGGIGEMEAIEFEIDIGDAKGIYMRGCGCQYGRRIGLFFWGRGMGGIGMTAMDGVEGVPDVFPVGAKTTIERFDGEIGYHDIRRLDAAFSDDVLIGFRCEVADDENAAVVGGDHFLFQLEPSVLKFLDPGVHETDIFFRL